MIENQESESDSSSSSEHVLLPTKDDAKPATKNSLPFILTVAGSITIFILVVIALWYVFRKKNTDDGLEYTKAILGDNAFEFSQLDTI